MTERYLLREVEEFTGRPEVAGTGLTARVRAVACRLGPDGYGYLTGESLADQGIETTMPNLPELDTPPLHTRRVVVHIGWSGHDTVRVTVTPAEQTPSAPTGREHDIVRTCGKSDVEVTVD
ncbi:MAG: hypothetical protein ABS980_31455, partial [Rhodococcus sp. (in: high G+C Gram-positive bacteria)]